MARSRQRVGTCCGIPPSICVLFQLFAVAILGAAVLSMTYNFSIRPMNRGGTVRWLWQARVLPTWSEAAWRLLQAYFVLVGVYPSSLELACTAWCIRSAELRLTFATLSGWLQWTLASVGTFFGNIILIMAVWELWRRWDGADSVKRPVRLGVGAGTGLLCGVLRVLTLADAPDSADSFLNPSEGTSVPMMFRVALSLYFVVLFASLYLPLYFYWNAGLTAPAAEVATDKTPSAAAAEDDDDLDVPIPRIQSKFMFWLSIFIGVGACVAQLAQIWRGLTEVGTVVGVVSVAGWALGMCIDRTRSMYRPRSYVLVLTAVMVTLPNAVGNTMLPLLSNRSPSIQLGLVYIFHVCMGTSYFMWRVTARKAVGAFDALPYQFLFLWLQELFGSFLFLSVDLLSLEFFLIVIFQRAKDCAVFAGVGRRMAACLRRMTAKKEAHESAVAAAGAHHASVQKELQLELEQWHLSEIAMLADLSSTLCVLITVLAETATLTAPNGHQTLTEGLDVLGLYVSYGLVFLSQLPVVLLVRCWWSRHLVKFHATHKAAVSGVRRASVMEAARASVSPSELELSEVRPTGTDAEETLPPTASGTLSAAPAEAVPDRPRARKTVVKQHSVFHAAEWEFSASLTRFWLKQRPMVAAMTFVGMAWALFVIFLVTAVQREAAAPM